jgi:hypothetical protein
VAPCLTPSSTFLMIQPTCRCGVAEGGWIGYTGGS